MASDVDPPAGEQPAARRPGPTPRCWPPTPTATPTRSASWSAGTATGCGPWPCAPSATARRRPTPCRTRWSRRSGGAGAFRGESAVTTWLHRIVVNACLDRMRRRRGARPRSRCPDDRTLGRPARAASTPRASRPAELARRDRRALRRRCPRSSGPRWCSSTCTAGRSRTPPRSWTCAERHGEEPLRARPGPARCSLLGTCGTRTCPASARRSRSRTACTAMSAGRSAADPQPRRRRGDGRDARRTGPARSRPGRARRSAGRLLRRAGRRAGSRAARRCPARPAGPPSRCAAMPSTRPAGRLAAGRRAMPAAVAAGVDGRAGCTGRPRRRAVALVGRDGRAAARPGGDRAAPRRRRTDAGRTGCRQTAAVAAVVVLARGSAALGSGGPAAAAPPRPRSGVGAARPGGAPSTPPAGRAARARPAPARTAAPSPDCRATATRRATTVRRAPDGAAAATATATVPPPAGRSRTPTRGRRPPSAACVNAASATLGALRRWPSTARLQGQAGQRSWCCRRTDRPIDVDVVASSSAPQRGRREPAFAHRSRAEALAPHLYDRGTAGGNSGRPRIG